MWRNIANQTALSSKQSLNSQVGYSRDRLPCVQSTLGLRCGTDSSLASISLLDLSLELLTQYLNLVLTVVNTQLRIMQ